MTNTGVAIPLSIQVENLAYLPYHLIGSPLPVHNSCGALNAVTPNRYQAFTLTLALLENLI